ncbi:hypothetical protein BKA70DRAFT_1432927 [Coprinopsis sp. MPI-PUGE-AT-0042]|nr:hypothetical protein BKA70DRAFT_1432927 [Coprinopsis sp. MPI-PUGE-AT-0042]
MPQLANYNPIFPILPLVPVNRPIWAPGAPDVASILTIRLVNNDFRTTVAPDGSPKTILDNAKGIALLSCLSDIIRYITNAADQGARKLYPAHALDDTKTRQRILDEQFAQLGLPKPNIFELVGTQFSTQHHPLSLINEPHVIAAVFTAYQTMGNDAIRFIMEAKVRTAQLDAQGGGVSWDWSAPIATSIIPPPPIAPKGHAQIAQVNYDRLIDNGPSNTGSNANDLAMVVYSRGKEKANLAHSSTEDYEIKTEEME